MEKQSEALSLASALSWGELVVFLSVVAVSGKEAVKAFVFSIGGDIATGAAAVTGGALGWATAVAGGKSTATATAAGVVGTAGAEEGVVTVAAEETTVVDVVFCEADEAGKGLLAIAFTGAGLAASLPRVRG